LQSQYGFEVHEIPRQQIDEEKVSSTVVRRLISEGEMAHASHLLNRPYLLITSVNGKGECVDIDPYKLLPPMGHYEVNIEGYGRAELEILYEGVRVLTDLQQHCKQPIRIDFISSK
jgi:FAD synthase